VSTTTVIRKPVEYTATKVVKDGPLLGTSIGGRVAALGEYVVVSPDGATEVLTADEFKAGYQAPAKAAAPKAPAKGKSTTSAKG
jgi:hypothetical protein